MPHTAYASAVIGAPIEQVWPLFRDFNALSQWHPGIRESRLEAGGRGDAVGSVRHLTLASPDPARPDFVREQLPMLDDPGTALRYSIIETSLPMRDYVAGVRMVSVTATGQTFAEWWADFGVKPGAQLADVAALVSRGVFAAGLAALDRKLSAR